MRWHSQTRPQDAAHSRSRCQARRCTCSASPAGPWQPPKRVPPVLSGNWVHVVAAFGAAAAITALMRKLGPRWALLAVPNSRSAHQAPTPTGGGIGFVVPVLAWLALAVGNYPPALTLAIAGAAIATLGLLDDVKDLPRNARFACQLALAGACVVTVFESGPIVAGVAILGLTWWVNVYNFMDGTDGLAASQTVAFVGGALLLGNLDQSEVFAWVLVAATAGFLCFNWAPAKIFMGDVGALFLGLTTGVLALWLGQSGEMPFVASCILLVAFWFDATYTLLMRIVTRQAFVQAHRTHLYQVVCQRLGHGRTAALFWLHSLAWAWPLAGASIAWPEWQFACLGAACLPLAVACVAYRAGVAGKADAR